MFLYKKDLNKINILHTDLHKSFPIRSKEGNFLTLYLHTYTVENVMKIRHFIEMRKSMFHVQNHTKLFTHVIGDISKRPEMCFKSYSMVLKSYKM